MYFGCRVHGEPLCSQISPDWISGRRTPRLMRLPSWMASCTSPPARPRPPWTAAEKMVSTGRELTPSVCLRATQAACFVSAPIQLGTDRSISVNLSAVKLPIVKSVHQTVQSKRSMDLSFKGVPQRPSWERLSDGRLLADDLVLNGSWKRWPNWGQARGNLNLKEGNHFSIIQLRVEGKCSYKTLGPSVSFVLRGSLKLLIRARFAGRLLQRLLLNLLLRCGPTPPSSWSVFGGPRVIRRQSRLWLMPLGGRLLGEEGGGWDVKTGI